MVTRSSSTSPTRLLEAVCHILIWALSLAQQSWDLEVQAAYGQRLHRSWTLIERALGQSASIVSKSVSLASPCSAMSRSTL